MRELSILVQILVAAVALLALQMPLCAVACLEAASPPEAAMPMPGMPCHGASEPEPDPAPLGSEPDCTCVAAAVQVAGDAQAQLPSVALVAAQRLRAVSPPALAASRNRAMRRLMS